MNNSRKILLIIATFSILFSSIIGISLYTKEHKNAQINSYEKDELIFQNLLLSQEENLKILSNTLALNKDVEKAYITNNPNLIRETLLPIWKQEKLDKLIYEMHFFKPPATSFVNFSNFKSIGTDVSDVRTDISWITMSFEQNYHPLMCKTYAGYRVTTPIFDSNHTILGGLSIGKTLDWLPSSIKRRGAHDSFLVYPKEATKTLSTKYHKAFLQNKLLIGNYILANQTKPINPLLLKSINFSSKIQSIIIDDKKYQLNIYPVIDFNKNVLAYVCTLDNLNDFFVNFYKTLFYGLMLTFITAMMVFFLSRKVLSRLIKEVDFISKISENIKIKDFSILHHKEILSKTSRKNEALNILQNNIIEMGLEIEKKYNTLEEESKHKTELLVSQLYTDKLTKLANRSALFRDLDIYNDSYLAILNIKNFKSINDIFGADSGNLILQQLASFLLKINKTTKIYVYRIGNDEFALINYKNMSESDFEVHIQFIIHKIEKEIFYASDDENADIEINTYAGISFQAIDKLRSANNALRTAKQKNKDYFISIEEENSKKQQINNMQTIQKIKFALENDGILVYFQPITNNEGVTIKYEALVRMKDGETVLSPYFFLEIAQSTKYYHYITQQVIQKTFDAFKDRKEMFSINLIAQDIMNEDTIALIFKNLKQCKNTHKVIFEIVESEDVYDVQEVSDFIHDIKNIGASIAIDDFGTGFSNFSYIMEIHPEYLKIDGSIIKNIDTDPTAKQITKTIVAFAKELKIKTIAEFVASEEIYLICKELGVDEYQGYYFSEPIPL